MLPKTKWGNCSQCSNTDCAVSKVGKVLFCMNCHKSNKAKAQMQKAKLKSNTRSLINTDANNKMIEQDKLSKAELDLWFMAKMKESPRKCQNCNKDLSNLNDTDWKGSQHHILEKSIFKSVKTHPNNHLVLGRWCCHPQVHTSMKNASKMNVFSLANEKVIEMLPLLTNYERCRVSEYYTIPL